MDAIGRKRWASAEGHIPSRSSFTDRALISHETACILNVGSGCCATIFFADRVSHSLGYISARRTLHLRFNDLGTVAGSRLLLFSVFEVMFRLSFNTHARSRHAEVSLLSTTAYGDLEPRTIAAVPNHFFYRKENFRFSNTVFK